MLDREDLIRRSGVRNVFIPNKPIDSIELFSGRQEEVNKIIECLGTSGLHVLLYGDRGVGKTSLSSITCSILTMERIIPNFYIKRCDSGDTFSSIIMHLVEELNIECILKKNKSWGLSILWNLLSFSKGHNIEVVTYDNINSPSWVAKKVAHEKSVFLIDEIDVLLNPNDKKKIAELIKQLSDNNSKFTIFIVGISKTASELTGGHPSIQRCLKEVRLDRMSDNELRDILIKGEERLNIKFSNEVKRVIIKSSAGFPYFTQLLALKSAEEAIAKDSSEVTMSEFKIAVKRAVDDIEGELREKYQLAVYGQKTERNKNILLAAAICGEDIFEAAQLKNNYSKVTGETISQQELNNFLSNTIISDGYSTILRRVGKGIYIFNDPRMPSLIKLINNYVE